MDTMGDDLRALLSELHEWGREHDASQRRRGDRLRNLKLLLPKPTPDAMLLDDNALSHSEEISVYLAALEKLPEFDRLIVPVGKGPSIAYSRPPGRSQVPR